MSATDLISPSAVMMTADEARLAVASFRDYMASTEHYLDRSRKTLLDLYEREGWRALGYASWRACAVAELNLSQAQVYRLLGAALVEQDIAPVLQDSHHENLSEAALRPLLQLDSPEQRQAAARVAIEAAGGQAPSSVQMREAVEQIKPPQTCGHPITAGSTKIDGILYCPSCAGQVMAAQSERAAAERRARDELLAMPDAVRIPIATLQAHGWIVLTRAGEYRLSKGGDAYATNADGVIALARLAVERPDATPDELAAAVSALDEEPPLPTPPDGWTIWRNDDDQIGMRHTSGYKISGADAAELIADAAACSRWLGELAGHAWTVFYDPTCPAHLHAFTATHQSYETIAAADLTHLALLAWRSRLYEDDLPNAPDSIIDALYLAGYDWRPDADGWMRGAERIGQDTPLAELYYLAGIAERDTTTTTTTTPPCAHCEKPSAGKRNIGGLLIERCAGCAAREEEHDLREQLGAQYQSCVVNLDGAWHYIKWHGTGAEGNYTYDEALAMLNATATQLRQFAAVCERAEKLGATIDYQSKRDDGKYRVIPPDGYQQTALWCDAKELARLCDSWQARTNGQHAAPPPPAYVSDSLDPADIWQDFLQYLADHPAALLRAARAALDSLADSEALSTIAYEDLYRRIGAAERALATQEAVA